MKTQLPELVTFRPIELSDGEREFLATVDNVRAIINRMMLSKRRRLRLPSTDQTTTPMPPTEPPANQQAGA